MNPKSFKTLEFDKILNLLEQKAIGPTGKERAKSLIPSIDIEDIIKSQEETTDACTMILKKGALPLGGIKDIRPSLQRVEAYGVLNILELLHIQDFIYVCKKAINYSKSENKDDVFPNLEAFFEQLEELNALEKELNRTIANEHTLKDDASSTLREIRSGIKSAGTRIKEQLNTIVNSSTYKTMLQDAVITMRSGRYCVPIKQEYKNAFPGMIHDQSSTGATVFMEPMSVVSLNNKIKDLTSKEQEETDKILKALSRLVGEHSQILRANLEILTILDFIFAKGELSLEMNATAPIFNKKGYVNITKGRHPLINKDKIVPSDMYLGKDFTTLLITGPNTGGKTVTLKTIGLFALMGQAGLHIPAGDKSELAVFDNVFADIGDEQSIEQNLSTFSSHMKNIVKILGEVSDNSLVLLDELGAGTDPTEGAALAKALLQYFHDRQIRTVVTTHYSELKLYALSTQGVENAACEFDVQTLAPTYKLLIGTPGKSNAFAISKKLGLEDHIINAAKNILTNEDEKIEDLITDLEINKRTIMEERDKAAAQRRDAEAIKQELEIQKQKILEQKAKILDKAKAEAREILMQAKDTADNIIKDMVKKSNQSDVHELDRSRKELARGIEKLSDKKQKPKGAPPKNLKIGDKVFIHSLSGTGIISALPDGDKVMVKAGIMKIKVPLTDISIDNTEEKIQTKYTSPIANVKTSKSANIKTELDIRGHMLEEGIEKTDKYLDDAYLAGLKQVRIIHGKGTGALRNGIQKFLKNHYHVESFREGEFGEGDSGVTIATLK